MKARILLLLFAAALAGFGIWSILHRGARRPVPAAKPVHVEKKPEVPIQNGKTIDFSTGTAVVKDSTADREALDKSVADMDAAAGNVTFAPTASTATPSTAPSKK